METQARGNEWQVARAGSTLSVPSDSQDTLDLERAADVAVTPFRFMDLPKELRLMVYELLPIKTKHKEYDATFAALSREGPNSFTVIIKTIPGIQILATNRLINSEASSILAPKIDEILSQPSKMLLPFKEADRFFNSSSSPLWALSGRWIQLKKVRRDLQRLAAPLNEHHGEDYMQFVDASLRSFCRTHQRGEHLPVVELGLYADGGFTTTFDCRRVCNNLAQRLLFWYSQSIIFDVRIVRHKFKVPAKAENAHIVPTFDNLPRTDYALKNNISGAVSWGPDVDEGEWDSYWMEGEYI